MKSRSKLSRYLLIAGVIVVMAAAIPGVMAYEGHTINVKAHVKGDIQCEVVTRTPGWWTNRVDAITWVLENRIPGNSFNMGWPNADIDSVEKIMGIFWADRTKEMDCAGSWSGMRDDLCAARAKASFQVLAAILTSYCPAGKALPISLGEIQAIMGGTNISAILALHAQMAAFNLSADYNWIPTGIPASELGQVNAPAAKAIAWEQFANCEILPCP